MQLLLTRYLRRSSLFWGLFLFFLLAMLLATALSMVVQPPKGKPSPWLNAIFEKNLEMLGEQLAETHEAGDDAKLVEIATTWRKRSGMRLFLFYQLEPVPQTWTPPTEVVQLAHKAVGKKESVVLDYSYTFYRALALDRIDLPNYVIVSCTSTTTPLTATLKPIALKIRITSNTIIAVLACLLLTLLITQPIKKLCTVLREFSAGNLHIRYRKSFWPQWKEVDNLSEEFNVMADMIEKLLREKELLLRDISHELKAPLARISMMLGIASTDCDKCDPELLESLEKEISTIDALIQEILILSRYNSIKELRDLQPVNLADLIEDICDELDYEIKAKRCIINCNLQRDIPFLAVVEIIRRGIDNIIRNAVRHNAPDTRIDISLETIQAEKIVKLKVRDHGNGLDEDCLKKIFEPFIRCESNTEGFGIGLAIAKKAVNLHRGIIYAENVSDGGFCVTLELPLKQHLLSCIR